MPIVDQIGSNNFTVPSSGSSSAMTMLNDQLNMGDVLDKNETSTFSVSYWKIGTNSGVHMNKGLGVGFFARNNGSRYTMLFLTIKQVQGG